MMSICLAERKLGSGASDQEKTRKEKMGITRRVLTAW